ncbi:MAG: xanthine dehydrogenase family protein molybdopterin-binding subunit [Planctomycetota bacterium]|jgi:xanthine dehydrogenase YagR molybdenum-binding subunit
MSAPRDLKLGFPGGTPAESKTEPPSDAPPPWDLNTRFDVVGKDHPRLDAADKVTGAAVYSSDVQLPGLCFAGMVRSPHAAARVTAVHLDAATAVPGVVAAERVGDDTIRYAGQEVAGIVAESEEALADAIAAVRVEYDVQPHVVTIADAEAEGAPRVLARGGNVRRGRRSRSGDPDAVAKAHAEADIVVEQTYTTQVQVHTPLEPHGSTAHWTGGHLTVYASTQATFAFRDTMARGIGSKFVADGWDVFAAKQSRALNRPVRVMLDRRAEIMVAGMRPNSVQRCKFSIMEDGTLMGAEVHAKGTGGVGGGAGVANPAVYQFKAAFSDQANVLTNAGRARAFRAPRHPQGFFALEGMIDELAEAIGMDPLAVRRKNDHHPVRPAQYDLGAKAIGWDTRAKSGSARGRFRRGLGMAASRWHHSVRKDGSVTCRIARDGSVLLANGAQDIGTGTRTIIAVIGAEELGLPVERVQVRLGHTNDPYGHPSGGSTTCPSVGPAVRHAAWLAKHELLVLAAEQLECDVRALDLESGQVTGGPKAMSFAQACALIGEEPILVTSKVTPAHLALPRYADEVAGCQFAEVEVDCLTGVVRVVKVVAVQDCGQVIDTLTARSQINGGVLQGISYALYEDHRLDRRTGNAVTTNLLDYKFLGAHETPAIEAIPFSVANGISHTGQSSLGEPPKVPTAAAIGNAVANALGARVRSLPITPDKVLAALAEAGTAEDF